MKIYLLDIDKRKTDALKIYFDNIEEVETVTDAFNHFMDTHDVDCIVSPANAFGLMDGGYDAAITRYFGDELQLKVQEKIINEFGGHQTLGTAITVDATPTCKLIHVPTMCMPSRIKDPFLIYECMRSTLFEARRQNVEKIVIPTFGGATGDLNPDVIAKMMFLGYKHFKKPNTDMNYLSLCSIVRDFEKLGIPLI